MLDLDFSQFYQAGSVTDGSLTAWPWQRFAMNSINVVGIVLGSVTLPADVSTLVDIFSDHLLQSLDNPRHLVAQILNGIQVLLQPVLTIVLAQMVELNISLFFLW